MGLSGLLNAGEVGVVGVVDDVVAIANVVTIAVAVTA
jgi:hypothetical protein